MKSNIHIRYASPPTNKDNNVANLRERKFVVIIRQSAIIATIIMLDIAGEINVCHKLGLSDTSFLI